MLWTVPKEHSKTKVAIFRPIPEAILPFVTKLVEQNRHTGLLLGELKGQSSVSEYGRTAHRRINQALDVARHPAHVYNDAERFRRGSSCSGAANRAPVAECNESIITPVISMQNVTLLIYGLSVSSFSRTMMKKSLL